MKTLLLKLTAVCALIPGACSSGSSLEDDLRTAEMAIANGDMVSAESATKHIVGSENLSGLTSRQLARLSMIYIQMADSLDREDNMGQAANYYRRSFEANCDSAIEFYSSLPPQHLPYAMMLRALAQPRDTNDMVHDDIIDTDSLLNHGLD